MKVILALLATALLLAGCTKSAEPSVPAQDDQGRYVIHMTAAQRFTPDDAQVPVGSTVVWQNDDGVHDVTAHDDSWKSPRVMSAGATYEHKFEAAGEYEYHCTLHSDMTGTLHVGDDE